MLRSTGKLIWIESSNSPLLLLSRDYLPSWRGIQPPQTGPLTRMLRLSGVETPATDYDRALAVHDFVGLIDVGRGQGLVLDAQSLVTTWWTPDRERRGGILVRYIFADDEVGLLRLLQLVPASLWQPGGVRFEVGRAPLVLFDALYGGADSKNELEIDLRPGSYGVDTALYEPDDTLSLLLHRLRPL